ncbi:MAG: hypothetical protein EZS28_028287, partial [Streblomastix strix]
MIFYAVQSFFYTEVACTEVQGQTYNVRQSITLFANEYIYRNCQFISCVNNAAEGGGLFVEVHTSGIMIIDETLFEDCSCSGNGGGFYLSLVDTGSQGQIIDVQIRNCFAGSGGGSYIYIQDKVTLLYKGSSMYYDCTCGGYGAAMHIQSFSPENCIQFIGDVTFDSCTSNQLGGGMYLDAQNNGVISVSNLFFDECSAQNQGGGIYSRLIYSQSKQVLKKISMNNCRCLDQQGGGFYALCQYGEKTFEMEDITMINCSSGTQGGAMYFQTATSIYISIKGTSSLLKDCSSATSGGGMYLTDYAKQLWIDNMIFENCTSVGSAGGIFSVMIYPGDITLNNCQFKSCVSNNGNAGGILSQMQAGGEIVLNQCEFYKCVSNDGNGAGLCIIISLSSSRIQLTDVYIHECSALSTDATDRFGYGGGMFIGGNGNYDVSSKKLDLRGMKINGNTASKAGYSVYVVISTVEEWCKIGNAGEYVKGNYTDNQSDQIELYGIKSQLNSFFYSLSVDSITTQQKPLEYYWNIPKGILWHLSNRNEAQIHGTDQPGCAEYNNPCRTIEFALEQISITKGGLAQSMISEKRIGINEDGYNLNIPFQFIPTECNTNIIKIMKQLYGTNQAMIGQSEIKILKNNEISKENGKQGWISTVDGLQLGIFGIKFITDLYKLTIPIIYIQDSNSILELYQVTFSDIDLSPLTQSPFIPYRHHSFNLDIVTNKLYPLFDAELSKIFIPCKSSFSDYALQFPFPVRKIPPPYP